MIYLFCGLFGGALIAAVVSPLFRKDDSLDSAIIDETEWDLLQRKKEVTLSNIQDLDFEYKCGKLSDEDYAHVRSEMTADAAKILHRIEEIESSQDLDALIRREVAIRRGKTVPATDSNLNCPSCKAKNPGSNKFCAECGAKLSR